jgi:hypothetical protein
VIKYKSPDIGKQILCPGCGNELKLPILQARPISDMMSCMNIGSLLITIGVPLLALETIAFRILVSFKIRIPIPFYIYDIGIYAFFIGIFLFHFGRLIANKNGGVSN